MRNSRPVNLNLFTMHFPLPAIASILHRVSGVFIFLCLPFLLWMLNASLASPEKFAQLQTCLHSPSMRFACWVIITALAYHLFAGIRHLFMDMGIGETLKAAPKNVMLVMLLTAAVAIGVGVWLW